MLGVYVTVPIACFRKGMAREFLETEPIPPPATCYGFLLSLVGETKRQRHIGCRVAPVLVSKPAQSVVLRTVWRIKKTPLGSAGNTRPDYQQLLTGTELVIWVDSMDESRDVENLESRVERTLRDPSSTTRFGGLSLGESTHLVDEVSLFPGSSPERWRDKMGQPLRGQVFLRADRGRLTLPVWVDHVGSGGTRYVTGDLSGIAKVVAPDDVKLMPRIDPEGRQM